MEMQHGLKLWLIILALDIGLFLSSLDSTIVATALVSIAADFKNYNQSSWVVIAYLVTYSSFLIIFARLSDSTGRKPALLTGLIFFILTSLACALARTSNELIVFRALQGIGASGIYAPALVIATEITPQEKTAYMSASLSVVFALASAVGPVVGGAITTSTTWRWCFWLNLPAGALVILLVLVLVPWDPPTGHGRRESLAKIDWLGAVLCLAASILVTVPLQLGGDSSPWNSAVVVVTFTMGGLCWILLACWEMRFAKASKGGTLPLFPVRVLSNRVVMACICTLFLTGLGFTSTVVYLPQKFQVADDLTPARAGLYMLPLVVVSALAGIVVGVANSKKNVAASFTLLGNALQLLGLGLTSSLSESAINSPAQFGYQVLMGFGFGTTISSAFILARIEVARGDIAPMVGAVSQLRILGGVIGIAVARVVLFSVVSDGLLDVLSVDELAAVKSSVTLIDELTPALATTVRQAYGSGFALQTRVLTYVAAANVFVALFTFRRHAKPLRELAVPQPATTREEQAQLGADDKARSSVTEQSKEV